MRFLSNDPKRRRDELDQFWDISRLVPQKPKSEKTTRVSTRRTEAVDVHISSPSQEQAKRQETSLTIQTVLSHDNVQAPSPVYAEYFDFSPFIPHVKVINWKSTYNYYEFFCRQAAVLYKKKGEECPEASFSPYFSYVAQYSQLNRRQLDWYLWWRECVRNERYLKTDVSYIHLLVFELINLGDSIDTKKSLDMLIALWANYKDEYPQLCRTLCDWICDYSLIYGLPIPFPDGRTGNQLLAYASLPEAFYNFDINDVDLLSKFLLSSCNSYNYRKSKFYTEENKTLYDTYIPQVISHWITQIDVRDFLSSQPRKSVSRMAFTGALCSYKKRKHIEVEYISLCDSLDLRARIGDMVKYAENKIRTYLGIRSKLGVREIAPQVAGTIDAFFSKTFGASGHPVTKIPEYEKLYDAAETHFSIESALDIEKTSWEITEKLVDAFEEEAPAVQPLTEKVEIVQEIEVNDRASDAEQFMAQIARHTDFFNFLRTKDEAGLQLYVKQNHLLPDAVIDEINEIAVNIIGDILIEQTDFGYQIIEEYRSIFE